MLVSEFARQGPELVEESVAMKSLKVRLMEHLWVVVKGA